jgi:hypothetical protein
MDQPYSVIADWLSKFHTWPESIQALWLIAVPVTVLGVTWIVMRGLRDLIRLSHRDQGHPVHSICQDKLGRWVLCRYRGKQQQIDSIKSLSESVWQQAEDPRDHY